MPDVPVHCSFGISKGRLHTKKHIKKQSMDKSEKRKRIRYRRRVKGEWPDKKTRELIAAVEVRPELWDGGSSGSKTPKTQLWQEVAVCLGDTYVWHDCRIKWQNLRVTYRCNQAKMVKKKGTDEESHVQWRFFKSMQFIDSVEIKQPNKLTNNSKVNDCYLPSDTKLTDASCSTPPTLPKRVSTLQIEDAINVDKHEHRSITNETLSPPPSVASNSLRDIAAHVQQVMNKNDEHSAFADYIASELRNLSPQHAFTLKRRLNRTLLDFWDEIEESQTRTSPRHSVLDFDGAARLPLHHQYAAGEYKVKEEYESD